MRRNSLLCSIKPRRRGTIFLPLLRWGFLLPQSKKSSKQRRDASKVAKIREQEITNPLTFTEVSELYNKLYPYAQVSDDLKNQHMKR
jgi:hypothetical protein